VTQIKRISGTIFPACVESLAALSFILVALLWKDRSQDISAACAGGWKTCNAQEKWSSAVPDCKSV